VPLVRISLVKGKSAAYVRSIADGVHKALVETYDVPENDRFQLIQQHDRDEFLYDPDYLNIHRTDDAIFINIVASRTRDTASKQVFYQALAGILSHAPGLRSEDIMVVFSPNDRDDWSFGLGLASYVNDSEQVVGARR
jgi:phenylpyruvate tautomerase PptA (4-oxalocrotonate tautomerase family)